MPASSFESCRFPLFVVAADLTRGRRHVFQTGDLVSAIQASCAYPLLFENVVIGDTRFADGGLADKVPLDELVAGRPDLILVNHLLVAREDRRPDQDGATCLAPFHQFKRGLDVLRERELRFKLHWVKTQGVRIEMLEPRVPAVGPRRLEFGPRALAAAHAHAMAKLPAILGPARR